MPDPQPALLVDRATMAEVFGEADLATVGEVQAAVLTHAPTRGFLTRIGLPDQADTQGWFHRALDLDEEAGDVTDGRMCLGEIPYDSVDVDTATGVVHVTPEDADGSCVLNSSLDVFAYLLCVLEAERPCYSGEAEQTLADPVVRRRAEELLDRLHGAPHASVGPTPQARLRAAIERVDPAALAHPDSTWHRVLELVTDGIA
ncbi:SUKH-4 family immunity protein [Streptacidiphilus jiangxiensis]|uniref:SUKH-4 immunity protein n=1 Tax=Streptacidiphilus jiangxiensis TaxID=235985 RepID=A0A1H7V6B9_STRJI|nr:SUKH-4 family immunity protein [Streptacidiphilus jiangxiensis]SEM04762.1 SUKH-4 immunity protein [Streptacidiphilus jiangxiensis]